MLKGLPAKWIEWTKRTMSDEFLAYIYSVFSAATQTVAGVLILVFIFLVFYRVTLKFLS